MKVRLLTAAALVVALSGCGSSSSAVLAPGSYYSLGSYGSTSLTLKVAEGGTTYEVYGSASGVPAPGIVTEAGAHTSDGGTHVFVPTPSGGHTPATVTCATDGNNLKCDGPARAYDQSTSLLSGETVSLTAITP